MQLFNLSSLLPVYFVSQPTPGHFHMTLAVKGTYDIRPGEVAALADEQLPWLGDTPHADRQSLRYPADLVPFKPATDLMLVGAAYAPAGRSVPQVDVSFSVGVHRHALRVYGDRQWLPEQGVMTEPTPFSRMTLCHERAWGGPDFPANPLGRGQRPQSNEDGETVWLMPNIESPGQPIRSPAEKASPAGWGPLPADWAQRMELAGTYDERWLQTRWPGLPEDFDWRYFNAAPSERQVSGYVSGEESVALEGLHPQWPRIETRLPGRRIVSYLVQEIESTRQAGVAQRQKRFFPIAMHLDTVWIDAEAGKLVLVWRGRRDVGDDQASDVLAWYLTDESLETPPQSDAEHYEQYKREAASGEKERAVMTREEAARENQQLQGSLGPDTPGFPEDLEGKPMDQQIEAVLAAADEIRSYANQHANERAEATGATPPAASRESRASAVRTQQIRATGAHHKAWKTVETLDEQNLPTHEVRAELIQQGLGPGPVEPGPPASKQELLAGLASGKSFAGRDLSELNLAGADLRGGDFSCANFSRAQLAKVDLTGANLTGAVMIGCDLSQACLASTQARGVIFSQACLVAANLSEMQADLAAFTGADLTSAMLLQIQAYRCEASQANFTQANLLQASLREAFLDEAVFDGALCREADFSEARGEGIRGVGIQAVAARFDGFRAGGDADFSQANFHQAQGIGSIWREVKLVAADFSYSQFAEAFFVECDLQQSNFYAAVLRQAQLQKSLLMQANLEAADLFQTSLHQADLRQANLRQANAYNADFMQADLAEADLRGINAKMTQLITRPR